MNTAQTVYFLGGPADLSKRVLRGMIHGAVYQLPAWRHTRSPLDTSEEAGMGIRIENYLIRQLDRDLWVAVHLPAE